MHNSKRRIMVSCLIAISLAFFSVHLVHAQAIFYGKITGTIIDDSGEPLPGVTVEVASDALIKGIRSAVTLIKGTYAFLSLPVGIQQEASRRSLSLRQACALQIPAGRHRQRDYARHHRRHTVVWIKNQSSPTPALSPH